MATILPGSPPSFNRSDIGGTVKALCNYTRSLQENIDFMLGQLKKDVATANTSIEGLNTSLSSLQRTVSGLQSSVTALGNNYTQLAARVTALEQAIN